MVRKPTPAESGPLSWLPPDSDFTTLYPTLVGFLADPTWDDGSRREPCTLTLRLGSGGAGLSLNDLSARASVNTNAGTVEDCLSLLEDALTRGVISWRPWRSGKK